jgi:anti-anti-sigma factor
VSSSRPVWPASSPPTAAVPASEWPAHPADTALSATVAAADGTVVATVSRHVERLPAGTESRSCVVIGAAGEFDQDTTPLLRLALLLAIDRQPDVRCDLSQVLFFGAAGLNTLVAAHLHAAGRGHRFVVRGAYGMTRRVLRITSLEEILCQPV